MHCGKGKLFNLALILFCLWGGGGGHSLGVIQNFLMPLAGWEENVFNKKNSPGTPVTLQKKGL